LLIFVANRKFRTGPAIYTTYSGGLVFGVS